MTSRPPHPPTDRRRALRLLSIASLTPLMAAVAACGGGGDAGGPAPVPPAPTPPAPGVPGPAWWGFGRDAQHSALGAIATQDLNRIAWSTPVDLAPQYTGSGALLIHYGSPVVTAMNTVIVPVKTGATGGFRFEARSGANGGLIWSAASDYVLPAHNWVPSYNLALTPTNRVLAPGAGGKLLLRDNADAAAGTLTTAVFYGAAAYNANPAAFDTTVFINTPLTADSAGNVFFGFIVTGPNPAGLTSGIARISAAGVGSWASATTLAADPAIVKVAMNCAPAVSPDLATLYFAVNQAVVAGTVQAGYLIAVDATTLALKGKVALRDPIDGGPARLSDNGTASPTIGPDGEVFFGVLEGMFGTHNGRGWLLHFDATLALARPPGGFGWDDTASVVPRAMLPSYTGAAGYLLMVKYNNYYGIGTGDGLNRVALIDPTAIQLELDTNVLVMKEILAIAGPTFVSGNSGPVEEWCINTAAVDPVTRSILVNSEDGFLYRWSLVTNTFTQRIRLTSGIAESYTPTAIGADGAVYAINNAVLFSIAG
ncbi:MAG: hypothetical protein V4569_09145 [Pseudomonadota bacterium]